MPTTVAGPRLDIVIAMAAISSTAERGLLEAARAGDERAYRKLIESHRGELHAHCYRMLGSVHDAEDALQEALLRAWRGLARFEGRSSPRSWLYRIATNTCLDVVARRPSRVLPMDQVAPGDPHAGTGDPLVESVWIEPYPGDQLGVEDGRAAPAARYERRESLELAFIAALQHLPANQRAALILREVLGFSAQETADALDTSVASVNSALQRARRRVDERLPERSQQETLRTLGDERLREIVERFTDAMERADVEAVVSMLAEDAAWSMPPLSSWYRGREALSVWLAKEPLSGRWRWRHRPLMVNAQQAVAVYVFDEGGGGFRPFGLNVLTLRGEQIAEVTTFIDRTTELPDGERFADYPVQPAGSGTLFERFGLPAR
jgi:RNA polymerase sigma-70 factor, ECF subfamily